MDRFALPIGCISLCLSLAAVVAAMSVRAEAAVWVGVGVAALFGYGGVMSVHRFDQAGPPAAR